jgi:hypothetical protein
MQIYLIEMYGRFRRNYCLQTRKGLYQAEGGYDSQYSIIFTVIALKTSNLEVQPNTFGKFVYQVNNF